MVGLLPNNGIEIEGLVALMNGLKKKATLSDVKRVVAVNGTELQSKAVNFSPYDTGSLSRSIKYSMLDKGFSAKVSANMNYAGYVEWGTRFMYGRLYMRRAFMRQRSIFIKDMKRLVRR